MKKKRRLTLLVLLLFSGLLLTMTTYAWFTANRIFEIESFDIQVATKGGIEVSTDAIDWKGVVGVADLLTANTTYPSNVNQVPNNVEPVSTAGAVEDGRLKLYYGEVEVAPDDYYLTASRSVETASFGEDSEGKFVAFDIFLRSQSPRLLTVAAGSGVSYKTEFEASGIENAFRLAFINQGTVDIEAAPAAAQGLNNGTSSLLWEVNYDAHTQAGIDHALNTYGLVTTGVGAARLQYHGITNEIARTMNMPVSRADANYYPGHFSLVRPDITTTKANTEPNDVMNIGVGVSKIRIYVWLEGQDVDCEDNASYGDLEINLQFIAK